MIMLHLLWCLCRSALLAWSAFLPRVPGLQHHNAYCDSTRGTLFYLSVMMMVRNLPVKVLRSLAPHDLPTLAGLGGYKP